METKQHQQRLFAEYLVLVFVIAWGLAAIYLVFQGYFLYVFGIPSAANPLFVIIAVSPTVAALLAVWRADGTPAVKSLLQRLLHWRFPLRYYGFVLLGVPALGWIATRLSGSQPFSGQGAWWRIGMLWLAQVVLCPVALGGELGWRGFALPVLTRVSKPVTSSLVLGLTWAIWQAPAFFMQGTTLSQIPVAAFFLGLCASSIIATWLYQSSGDSVLATVLFYWSASATVTLLGAPSWPFALMLTVAAGVIIAMTRGSLCDSQATRDVVEQQSSTSPAVTQGVPAASAPSGAAYKQIVTPPQPVLHRPDGPILHRVGTVLAVTVAVIGVIVAAGLGYLGYKAADYIQALALPSQFSSVLSFASRIILIISMTIAGVTLAASLFLAGLLSVLGNHIGRMAYLEKRIALLEAQQDRELSTTTEVLAPDAMSDTQG